MEGGSDDPINLLKVCKTCHALITFGCIEDRTPRDMAAFMYQLGTFGLNFLLASNFYQHRIGQKLIDGCPAGMGAKDFDKHLRELGQQLYRYYLDASKSKIPWRPSADFVL
jgi:hypothetical protein